jgi:hypothetical protein
MLPQSQIKVRLAYDKHTGVFTWKIPPRSRPDICVGDIAGGIHSRLGYRYIAGYRASRLAWFFVYGKWPAEQIDHIDHNKANDSIANLRELTAAENAQNKNKPYKNNKLGVMGVVLSKSGLFTSSLKLNGVCIKLGRFKSSEEAHEAYTHTVLSDLFTN